MTKRIIGHNLIDGHWRKSARMEANRNPSDLDDVIGEYAWGTIGDAQDALEAARRALPGWSRGNLQIRSDILRRIGDRLFERDAELGTLLAREEGKILADAIGEIRRAAQVFHYFSGEVLRHPGSSFRGLRDGFNVSVDHEPVGVVALVAPWNFPMAVPSWKVGAALAYGNTVVLKPSEYTPGCALALAEIVTEAGVPPGVFNLLMGSGEIFGETLVTEADAISFTGSTSVGRTILKQAAASMTKVQLELGGKNPLIVLDDADLNLAVDVALQGSFYQTGQRCTASSRLIVTETIHDAFVEGMVTRLKALKIGDALDPSTQIGPVATDRQLARNLKFVAMAQEDGGERLCGGEQMECASPGYYMSPALFAGTDNMMRFNREEIFGPVVGIIKVKGLDEAMAVAIDTDYALSSGICTRNLQAAERFRRTSRAGMVMINAPTAGMDYHVPFGGRAPSGFGGREMGTAAADFYTESKTTYVNHGII